MFNIRNYIKCLKLTLTTSICLFGISNALRAESGTSWQVKDAEKCIVFTLSEEAGVPREAELVSLKGGRILSCLDKKGAPLDSLSLYCDSQRMPIQISKGKRSRLQENDNVLLPEDKLIFSVSIPADGRKIYHLYSGGTPTGVCKEDLKCELIAPGDYAKYAYDAKLVNSLLELKIRAGDASNEERRKRKWHHDNGCIVGLTYKGQKYAKIAFPFIGMRNINKLEWNGVKLLEKGPVRISISSERDFKSFKYPHSSNWAIFSKDRAMASKGKLTRTFSICANSPFIEMEDRYELEAPEKSFVVSYQLTVKCGALESREFIVPMANNGVKKEKQQKEPVLTLSPEKLSSGWLAVENAGSHLGMAYIFDPEKISEGFCAFNYPWVKKDSPGYAKQPASIILRVVNQDFAQNGGGAISFKLLPFFDAPVEKIQKQLAAMRKASLDDSILFCGISNKGEPLPAPRYIDRKASIKEKCDKAENFINNICLKVKESGIAFPEEFNSKINSYKEKLRELKNTNGKSSRQLELLRESELLLTEIDSLNNSFDMFRCKLFLQDKNSKNRGFACFFADSMEKIKSSNLPKKTMQKMELCMAKNESESFQLGIVSALKKEVKLKIEASDLQGPGNSSINSNECVKIYRVLNVAADNGDEPDALLPVKDTPGLPPHSELFFAKDVKALSLIKKGEMGVFWFTIHAPPGALPGKYEGSIKITSNAETMSIPFYINVFDFELPGKQSVIGDIWFRNDVAIARYYGRYATLEEFEAIAKWLSSYRLNTQLGYNHMFDKLKVFLNENGEWEFDFSEFTPWLKVVFSNGSNWFNANMGCGSGWTGNLGGIWSRKYKVTDKRTGKTFLYPEEKTLPSNFRIPPWELIKKPMFKIFWESYANYLKEHGWLDKCYLEAVDEPPIDENKKRSAWFKTFYSTIAKFEPKITRFSYGVTPSPAMHQWAEKYTDVWGPTLKTLDDAKQYLKEQKNKGRPFMTYVCGNMRKVGKNHTPDVLVGNPGIDLRMASWMVYKYGAKGILFFAAFPYKTGNRETLPEKRWPDKKWNIKYNGVGLLIYPAPKKIAFLPSIRLENIRDGLEDYEYLKMLEKLIKSKKGKNVKAQEELLSLNTLIESVMHWNMNPENLRKHRRKIAEAIENLNKEVR